MRIQRVSRFLTIAIMLMSIATISSHLAVLQMLGARKALYSESVESSAALRRLAQASRHLTDSARSYAATHDESYAAAYAREIRVDRNREIAAARLHQLDAAPEEIARVEQVLRLSGMLEDTEARAVEMTRRGDGRAALELLFGASYRDGVDQVGKRLEEAQRQVRQRFADRLDVFSARADLAARISAACMVLTCTLSVGALLLFYRRRVVRPLAELTRSVERVMSGKGTCFPADGPRPAHELRELARTLETNARERQELEQQQWLRQQLTEIGEAVQGAATLEEFGTTLLARVAPLVDAGAGLLHFGKESRHRRVASYAGTSAGPDAAAAASGGLVGQVLRDGTLRVLSDVPEGYLWIRSGLGVATPRHVLALPIALDWEAGDAVLELATFAAPGGRQLALLQQLPALLAPRLEIVLRNLGTRELLARTQEQARMLAESEHLLQAHGVELEAQARLLRDQKDALLHTKAWYQAVVEAAPDGMLVVDDAGHIVLANPQAARLFGYSVEELRALQVEQLLPPSPRDEHSRLRAAFVAGGGERTMQHRAAGELLAQRKDGSRIAVEIDLSTLPSLDGRQRCVCACVRAASVPRVREAGRAIDGSGSPA